MNYCLLRLFNRWGGVFRHCPLPPLGGPLRGLLSLSNILYTNKLIVAILAHFLLSIRLGSTLILLLSL